MRQVVSACVVVCLASSQACADPIQCATPVDDATSLMQKKIQVHKGNDDKEGSQETPPPAGKCAPCTNAKNCLSENCKTCPACMADRCLNCMSSKMCFYARCNGCPACQKTTEPKPAGAVAPDGGASAGASAPQEPDVQEAPAGPQKSAEPKPQSRRAEEAAEQASVGPDRCLHCMSSKMCFYARCNGCPACHKTTEPKPADEGIKPAAAAGAVAPDGGASAGASAPQEPDVQEAPAGCEVKFCNLQKGKEMKEGQGGAGHTCKNTLCTGCGFCQAS